MTILLNIERIFQIQPADPEISVLTNKQTFKLYNISIDNKFTQLNYDYFRI